jgi:hypothetical protein
MIANIYVIPAKAGIHFEMTIVIYFHQKENQQKEKMDPRFRGDDMKFNSE